MGRPQRLSRREMIAAVGGLAVAGAGCRHVSATRTGAPPSLASSPVRMLDRYDVVVVGSGYGAAVMAARLAGTGRSLCVLERGKEWRPGDFPETAEALPGAIRTDRSNPFGLFEFNLQPFADLDVVTGCGLGGTSLINAAIALRPEDEVFRQPQWPAALRREVTDGRFAAAFAAAEQMLRPLVWGASEALPRAKVFRASVEARGGKPGVLPLAIHRDSSGRNALGVPQTPCIDCGNCCTGCNVGAKNTLTTNYLPLARQRGADIFLGIEVLHLERRPQGWRLHYLRRSEKERPRMAFLDAGAVVLGAGSVGSTEILLRSRAEGLSLSSRLGMSVSANGDVLGFSYASRERTEGIGRAGGGLGGPGAALLGYLDRRSPELPLDERFLLIEGTVPSALSQMVSRALAGWARLQEFPEAQRLLVQRDWEAEAPADGALNHSMLLLACGHDRAQGRYVLEPFGRPSVRWPQINQDPAFARIEAEMRAHALHQGGQWLRNPRSTTFGGSRLMATHPLGGCPMGDDPDRGVVDHASRVFTAEGTLHPGLYVVDSAIIPRSLGVPPLLTITALAERAARLFIASRSDLTRLQPGEPASSRGSGSSSTNRNSTRY